MCIEPFTTPGGNPVIEVPGSSETSPFITEALAAVTAAVAMIPNVLAEPSAIAPGASPVPVVKVHGSGLVPIPNGSNSRPAVSLAPVTATVNKVLAGSVAVGVKVAILLPGTSLTVPAT